jgi:hypothetical protein
LPFLPPFLIQSFHTSSSQGRSTFITVLASATFSRLHSALCPACRPLRSSHRRAHTISLESRMSPRAITWSHAAREEELREWAWAIQRGIDYVQGKQLEESTRRTSSAVAAAPSSASASPSLSRRNTPVPAGLQCACRTFVWLSVTLVCLCVSHIGSYGALCVDLAQWCPARRLAFCCVGRTAS